MCVDCDQGLGCIPGTVVRWCTKLVLQKSLGRFFRPANWCDASGLQSSLFCFWSPYSHLISLFFDRGTSAVKMHVWYTFQSGKSERIPSLRITSSRSERTKNYFGEHSAAAKVRYYCDDFSNCKMASTIERASATRLVLNVDRAYF
jgi:hypothetical protein